MTDITNRVLPPPRNWQDLERLCFDLYSRMWRTNDAEMNGRQGQPQAGVDVHGTDRHEGGRLVGVQCKGEDQGYGGAVTEKELREEIEKAKTFEPPLQVFVLATTAPNDVVIQRVARTISQEHTSPRARPAIRRRYCTCTTRPIALPASSTRDTASARTAYYSRFCRSGLTGGCSMCCRRSSPAACWYCSRCSTRRRRSR